MFSIVVFLVTLGQVYLTKLVNCTKLKFALK
ncbi:hypothetical protein predicted by Glimmer/Critica [Lactiplantibacillus plantarum]|nr:hypothetical protein predicted by Glimmer/Critica [Lactiplantibacillus plantarum]